MSPLSPLSPACHQCFTTPNPRRGGGYRGFLPFVTTFLVNIKKGLLVVNGREKSVGVLIMVTIYIFILTTLIYQGGSCHQRVVTNGDKW